MSDVDSSLLKQMFHEARSQNGWSDQPVSDEALAAAYEIAKWGPTSMNTQPMRLLFIRSQEAKERLKPALAPGNVDKVMAAPVVAIVAHDSQFHEHLPRLFPHNPNAPGMFAGNEGLAQATAFRNGTLQGAYFIIALRAVGLDVGPMSGFDPAKVDAEFFAGTTFKSNFLCGIGHGDPAKVMGRLPRFELGEISQTL
ncbi:NADH dehydrogenase/NAD(P)H nitroreductase rutE [Sphingobium chlorophenolicum L-1]|uniref:Putative NADH dehydrogenase/NAD(P)H nitroreductase Sphch_4049 n=1 Tax=Sphingobium chlorophenolicum L-1 TaxID=690566 RepID=F6F298_SPHCR|nr:malonic semialdehyde reductase [Sphingobium chlorophenolicum]AEG51628.1 NADH dehydrogenase/NAD(P)H nitroreductase rutE [Sphingobium chlorophenolicum L-1]